ncbi:MAG: hypothetical protein IJ806_02155 [Ruminococcus sp.]|nr:hypothetical protein [Ruminococcus sp.]
MSLILSLTSAVVLIGASVTSLASLTAIETAGEKTRGAGPLQPQIQLTTLKTVFVDKDLLIETLQAHGSCVSNINVVSENEIIVMTECGPLRYVRPDNTQAFDLELGRVEDPQKLIQQLKSFEEEYGRNVQTYTYDHIKENLSGNMKIEEEEVLEDDSLLLTIDI